MINAESKIITAVMINRFIHLFGNIINKGIKTSNEKHITDTIPLRTDISTLVYKIGKNLMKRLIKVLTKNVRNVNAKKTVIVSIEANKTISASI